MNQVHKFHIKYKGFTIKVKTFNFYCIVTKKESNRHKIYGINDSYNRFKKATDFGLKASIEECKKEIDEFLEIDFNKYGRLELLFFQNKYRSNYKINKFLKELLDKTKYKYIDDFRF